jgi:beta-lysine 5,6-aminomutase alpha subunit
MGKLGLDANMVNEARQSARRIAGQMDQFVAGRTTVAIERTVLRLMGIDGVDVDGIPYVNRVVDYFAEYHTLAQGITIPIVSAMIRHDLTPQQVVEELVGGNEAVLQGSMELSAEMIDMGERLAEKAAQRIRKRREERTAGLSRLGEGKAPLLYVIVATGDIYEDIEQAKSAAFQGADIIAVIRSTGQSLLDYVPYGATREGFGGTYATQENFRLMREALDEVGEKIGRYIRLCNYCSGLCMPEIAAMGAFERLDVMLNDALYGILFRDINMQRTLIDQYFSRLINAYAGVIINTGEDNYLTTADAVDAAHTVLGSQLINEQFACLSGLPADQMGLGHAFEMNPELEDGFLLELAQAQMAREIFPDAPLKYMPPTKHMTGNIFKGHIQDALFNLAGVMTNQGIQLLGMMTEAMHTPFIHDRQLAIENAKYVMNNARHLGEEITFVPGGRIQRRAQEVLAQALQLLKEVEGTGLFDALEKGKFADVMRRMDGGKGARGVYIKSDNYFNPFDDLLRKELGLPKRIGDRDEREVKGT